MPLAVGIDAGGSAIRARSDDRAYELRESGNVRTVGVEVAVERIMRALRELVRTNDVDALYVGAAGAGDPAIAAALLAALSEALPSRSLVGVGDDIRIALRGAIDGDGIALIAGTGSVAYAEIGERSYRAGGFGPLLGDEGSGFAIGAAALRQAIRVFDERGSGDELTAELRRDVGGGAYEILARANASAFDANTVAAVAPIVLRCAEREVASAVAIVETAAEELVGLVRSVLAKIAKSAMKARDSELPLALCGGLLARDTVLRRAVLSRIRCEMPSLRVVEGADPALGALKAAHASLGLWTAAKP